MCVCTFAPFACSPVRLCDYIYVCLRFHSTLPFPSMCVFSPVAPSFTFAPHLPSTLVLSGSCVIRVLCLVMLTMTGVHSFDQAVH